MSNHCVIFGNNNFATLMSEYIKEYSDTQLEAFVVHKQFIQKEKIKGKCVVPYEEMNRIFPPSTDLSVLVTSGYKGMNRLRKAICQEISLAGYNLHTFLHPDAAIYTTGIGQGNIVLERAIIGKHVKIGIGNIIWNGVNISHHAHIGDYNFFAPSCTLGGEVHMADNCFLGLNSTIKGGVQIHSYVLVGAGAYLGTNANEYEVFVPGVRGPLPSKISVEMV